MYTLDNRLMIVLVRELEEGFGNGTSRFVAMGLPKNLHKGSHPCRTSKTSRRSLGHVAMTWAFHDSKTRLDDS